jgi:hypothetical protein
MMPINRWTSSGLSSGRGPSAAGSAAANRLTPDTSGADADAGSGSAVTSASAVASCARAPLRTSATSGSVACASTLAAAVAATRSDSRASVASRFAAACVAGSVAAFMRVHAAVTSAAERVTFPAVFFACSARSSDRQSRWLSSDRLAPPTRCARCPPSYAKVTGHLPAQRRRRCGDSWRGYRPSGAAVAHKQPHRRPRQHRHR